MPDYKEMYRILFHETSKAILALQNAQQKTEAIYIADDGQDHLIVISRDKKNGPESENTASHTPKTIEPTPNTAQK